MYKFLLTLITLISVIACGKEGLETTYYDNGNIMERINYKNGK